MSKILGIVRASTERQEVESQKKELIQFIKGFGYSDRDITIIESQGASAWKRNKKYLEFLSNIKSNILGQGITAVALWNLDRLGRVDEELILMKNWFIEHKVQLYCKSPYLKLLNDDGSVDGGAEIAFGVFASLVKQQTQDLFNKWKRGKDRNREQGKYNGGKTIPFGYAVDSDGYIIIDPKNSDIVIKLFGRASEGHSLVELEEWLSSMGVSMSRTGINQLLHRDKYIELVGEDLFFKTQQVISEKAYKCKARRKLWLQKKILCPVCHNHFINTQGDWQCVYHSSVYRKSPKWCANSISVGDSIVKYIVYHKSLLVYADIIYRMKGEQRRKMEEEIGDIVKQIEVVQDKLDKVRLQLERCEEEYILGNITKERKERMEDRIKDGSSVLKTRMEGLVVRKENLESMLEMPSHDDILEKVKEMTTRVGLSRPVLDEEMYEVVQKVVSQFDIRKVGKWKEYRVSYINGDAEDFRSGGVGRFGFRLEKKKIGVYRDVTGEYRVWKSLF